MKSIILIIYCLCLTNSANAQIKIDSFEKIKEILISRSFTLKNTEIQIERAKKEKISAIIGIIEPIGNSIFSFTNNTQIPVTLVPSEVMGGQPGMFQEVKFGSQYVTNLNTSLEIKLINLKGWENVRLGNLNIKVTESDNKITFRNLLETTAVAYFNIINLQEQLKAFRLNLLSADTLFSYTQNKFNNGLANIQDMNDSKANKLNIEESIRQLEFHISQQINELKLLCDIPDNESIEINQSIDEEKFEETPEILNNTLIFDNALEKANYAESAYDIVKYSNYPTLSLFAAYQKQQFNTQAIVFDKNVNWSTSSYFGVKISFPLPGAESLKQIMTAKYNHLIAENFANQMKIKSNLDNKQLLLEFEKAKSQLKNNLTIYSLRKNSYQKNLINYKEGVIGLEQTINSFNLMVNSQYSYLTSILDLKLVIEKIKINNKIN